jgi:hypothetical protein
MRAARRIIGAPPEPSKPVHQRVDPVDRVMLGLIRQMRIAGGREDRVMAEILLDFEEVDAGLDQVRGIAVAKAVRRNVFFSPHDSTTARRAF